MTDERAADRRHCRTQLRRASQANSDISLQLRARRAPRADRSQRRRQDDASSTCSPACCAPTRGDGVSSATSDITGLAPARAREARHDAHLPDQHAVPGPDGARSRWCSRSASAKAGVASGMRTVARQRAGDRRGGGAARDRCSSARDADAVTRNLPYGKQRLVEIALALATRPQVLLLDEPAAGIPSARERASSSRSSRAAARRDHPLHRARHGARVPLRRAHHGAGRRHAC